MLDSAGKLEGRSYVSNINEWGTRRWRNDLPIRADDESRRREKGARGRTKELEEVHVIDAPSLIFAWDVCLLWEGGEPVRRVQWATSLSRTYQIRQEGARPFWRSRENRERAGERGGGERPRRDENGDSLGTIRNRGGFLPPAIRSIHRVWFPRGASVFRAVARWVHSDVPDVRDIVCLSR